MGERKRKKKHVGAKKEKKIRAFPTPETRTLALHASPAFQYSILTELSIELT